MSVKDKTLLVCNCNRTMPLDADGARAGARAAFAASRALDDVPARARAIFAKARTGDLVVACTQEQRLLGEVAEEGGRAQEIRFVNIRETAGWSADARAATPKIAALLAMAALPDPEPVPQRRLRVERDSCSSPARVDAALRWADALHERLPSPCSPRAARPAPRCRRSAPSRSTRASVTSLDGWLGAFDVAWAQENPIDLDLCTRCNACLRACPESAIDESYQVDLDRCKDHRACVAACGAVGAIDFARKDTARAERFDLVLDLHASRVVRAAPAAAGLLRARRRSARAGEGRGRARRRCRASSRSRSSSTTRNRCARTPLAQSGLQRSASTCARALAIRPDGDRVAVEPHLCVGCGACTTVCPSGALTYAYPPVPDLAARIRTLLSTYALRGRARRVPAAPRRGRPRSLSRAWRAAGAGCPRASSRSRCSTSRRSALDVWLAALAWGATQVAVLATGNEAPQYRDAIALPDVGRRGDRPGARLPGRALPPRRRRGRARCALAMGARVAAARRCDVRRHAREAHDGRARDRASRAACPDTARGDPAARRCAVRRHRDRPRRVHDVPRLRRARAPRPRSLDNLERPQVRFIEAQVRAVRHLRGDLPRACDLARAAARPHARRARAARAERSRHGRLHALRQAARHAEDDRHDAREARRPFDVRRAGLARPPAHVRRLPGRRPDQEREQRPTCAT